MLEEFVLLTHVRSRRAPDAPNTRLSAPNLVLTLLLQRKGLDDQVLREDLLQPDDLLLHVVLVEDA